ncbi:MAG: FkbM family methyltransferase, partial [Ginsengibacter sp.]
MTIYQKIAFQYKTYRQFGMTAVWFLFRSKFKQNRLKNISITGSTAKLSLRNFDTDVKTFFQIFYAKEYDMEIINEPLFIIDCGANIGLSAVFFAIKYPKAKIIALEPDSENFKVLQSNTSSFPNVICLHKAVWSKNVLMEIIDMGTGNWGFQTVEATKTSANAVEATTIDDMMATYRFNCIDILKIDIEGAEKELFRKNYENWLYKTKLITIELHDFLDAEITGIFFKAI